MILTVRDILIDAMGLIGATEIDETPSSTEMAVALRTANVMLDRWSSQSLLLRSSDSIVFTLTPNKASYTIGASGCDIVGAKPLSVQSAYVTDNNIDYPMDTITRDMYDRFQDKHVSTSRPEYVAYDPDDAQQTVSSGTFYFYYTPDKPYSVSLDVFNYLNEFVNYTDRVNFDPAYYEAIIYGLAVRLFRRYNDRTIPVPQDIIVIAHDSLNNIKALNSVRIPAACDIPGARVSTYNVYTDGY